MALVCDDMRHAACGMSSKEDGDGCGASDSASNWLWRGSDDCSGRRAGRARSVQLASPGLSWALLGSTWAPPGSHHWPMMGWP